MTSLAAASADDLSIVIPVHDERESLPALIRQIFEVVEQDALDLRQVILVDDGSRDGSWDVMRDLARERQEIVAIQLRRNFGKATALNVGIDAATSSIVVTMDGDLQDDPAELARFVAAVGAGNDLVSGWKRVRHDPPSKTLPSKLFNFVTAKLSGIGLHDFNCGFKAYRREVFEHVELYGDLHRFVPVLAHSLGFRVGELEIRHHPRQFGQSKYGMGRLLRGFVDLMTVLTITRYSRRPGHLFGSFGTVLLGGGLVVLSGLSIYKFASGADIGDRPLLLAGTLAVIVGLQILFFGILAELINNRTKGHAPRALIREVVSTPTS